MKELKTTFQNFLNENNRLPKLSKKYLYHGTHINNLDDIQKFGLLPDFGDTVKGTEAYGYYMDDEYFYPEDRVGGILFFSNSPDAWSYSHYGKTPNIDEAVLVIVENNDTIFRKIGSNFYDFEGNVVSNVNYNPVDKLPPFIENGDFFSLEEQKPLDILYGERLVGFIEKIRKP